MATKVCPVCGEELAPDMTQAGAAYWDCYRCVWGFHVDDLSLVNAVAEISGLLHGTAF